MAEHGFTPGPWQFEDGDVWDTLSNNDPGVPLFRADYGTNRRWGRDVSRSEIEANARLIAASPTLLEALEELEQRADEVVAALDKYNAENGTHLGGPPFFKIGVALAKARAAITLATGKDA